VNESVSDNDSGNSKLGWGGGGSNVALEARRQAEAIKIKLIIKIY
jgi:hypothetical protein